MHDQFTERVRKVILDPIRAGEVVERLAQLMRAHPIELSRAAFAKAFPPEEQQV